MSIIISRGGESTTRLERTPIQDEEYLQKYIYEHPDTLPLDQLQADIRPLVLLREFPTTSGPIDALATDGDGGIYLIETKLYKNPDKRKVLAQILDYGAALWKAYQDPDDFVERLDVLMAQLGGTGISQTVSEFYDLDAKSLSEFIDNLKATIDSGAFRYVVLMDRIDDRLRDLIMYVNANSSFDLLGVALDFYQHEDLDILIPTLHGSEVKKQTVHTSGGRRRWDEDAFFADAKDRLSKTQWEAIKSLHDWAVARADSVSYGTGSKTGSFSARFERVASRSIFSVFSDGRLRLSFKWLDSARGRDWKRRFAEAVKREEALKLPEDFADRHIILEPGQWISHAPAFQKVLDELLPEVGESG